MKRLLVVSVFLMLSGCASYPDNLKVSEETQLTPFTDVNLVNEPSGSQSYIGKTVRWSGVIASISNEKSKTKLDVLYYPAANNGRPKTEDAPLGRFRVVIDGFVDPAIYRQGKSITVLGQLKQSETAKIGEYEYEYPTLVSQSIHLWKAPKVVQQVQFNYGWHGIQPRWHWRGGVRRVYFSGESNVKRASVQKPTKTSNE